MSTEAPLSPSPPRECNNAMTLGLAATTEGYAAENVFRWRRGQKRLENCLKSFSLRPSRLVLPTVCEIFPQPLTRTHFAGGGSHNV